MFWNLVAVQVERLHLKHLILFVMLILYSIIGAIVFVAIEGKHEQRDIELKHLEFQRARLRLLRAFHAIYNVTTIPPEATLHTAINRYNEAMGLLEDRKLKWDIWGGLYYAGTIYTTIGYGDLVATSLWGKVATVVYATFGVPLVILILNDWGSFLFNVIQVIWMNHVRPLIAQSKRFYKKTAVRRKGSESQSMLSEEIATPPESVPESMDPPLPESGEEPEPLPMLVVLFVFLFWMAFVSSLFMYLEGWPFGESAYFFFISLTTIGFGDRVPSHRVAVASFLLMLIGLSIVSMSINVVQMSLEVLFTKIALKIDNDFKQRMADTSEATRKSIEMGMVSLAMGDEREQTIDFVKDYEKNTNMSEFFLMAMMSNQNKKLLNQKFEEKAKMRNRACQTNVQIKVACVQTGGLEPQPEYSESSEEDEPMQVSPTTGKPIVKPRINPKRKLYIYNTGD